MTETKHESQLRHCLNSLPLSLICNFWHSRSLRSAPGVSWLSNEPRTIVHLFLISCQQAKSLSYAGLLLAGQWHGGRPCWLAQFKAPLPGELADDSAEAMDMCDEVARRARAISRKAIAQAEAFSHPEGRIQVLHLNPSSVALQTLLPIIHQCCMCKMQRWCQSLRLQSHQQHDRLLGWLIKFDSFMPQKAVLPAGCNPASSCGCQKRSEGSM